MEYGASSIFLRDMEMIIRVQMLMYGKEASNRKQEIDRQHHTIPNKRTKDQKTSTVEMCITCLSLRHFYPHLFETARILGV